MRDEPEKEIDSCWMLRVNEHPHEEPGTAHVG